MKIQLNENQRVFFVSDTHYHHLNICSGTSKWKDGKTRDFSDINKMNDCIINNINNIVQQDDILIHLGDVAFTSCDKVREFMNRLICKNVYLIYGNHDERIIDNKEDLQSLFKWFGYYMELDIVFYRKKLNDKKRSIKLILHHFPLASWNFIKDGIIHLHGHLHSLKEHKLHQGKSMDIGIDGNDLKPYSLEEILDIMKNQPIQNTILIADHHVK